MSAGFTPGPWTASIEAKPFGTGGHWYVVTDSEENGIGEFYGDDHEANAANLHLAAAAPDLYEALEQVREATCGAKGCQTCKPIRKIVDAARAKARGEQVR